MVTSEETNLNALTILSTSVAQKAISNGETATLDDIISSAKTTVASSLGIQADNIDKDYLKAKDPISLSAAAQITSVLNVVSSTAGGSNSSNDALDSFAELLTDSSGSVDLTSTTAMTSIIEKAAEKAGKNFGDSIDIT